MKTLLLLGDISSEMISGGQPALLRSLLTDRAATVIQSSNDSFFSYSSNSDSVDIVVSTEQSIETDYLDFA